MDSLASLVQPHWHTALVHFPIALLTLGVALEVCCTLFRSTTVREGGRWMILFGAILSFPAAASGLYAFGLLAREDAGVHWYEAARLSDATFAELARHAVIQSAASVLALGAAAVYLALSDGSRRLMYAPLLLVLLVTTAGSAFASHLASQAVRQADFPSIPVVPTSLPADWEGRAVFVTPPLQLHVALGALAIAVGVVSLATSLRNAAVARGADVAPKPTGREMHPGTGRADQPRPKALPLLPASRLLLLTVALTVMSGTAGWWHLSREAQTTVPRELWETVVTFPPGEALNPEYRDLLRRPAHVVLGTVLAGVPLLLALVAAVWPRQRLLTLVLGLLYLVAAAGQVWVGTLLLWDQPIGPLGSFVTPQSSLPR